MSRQIIQTFEAYQKARVQFVQTIADYANKPQNIETLSKQGTPKSLKKIQIYLTDDLTR